MLELIYTPLKFEFVSFLGPENETLLSQNLGSQRTFADYEMPLRKENYDSINIETRMQMKVETPEDLNAVKVILEDVDMENSFVTINQHSSSENENTFESLLALSHKLNNARQMVCQFFFDVLTTIYFFDPNMLTSLTGS